MHEELSALSTALKKPCGLTFCSWWAVRETRYSKPRLRQLFALDPRQVVHKNPTKNGKIPFSFFLTFFLGARWRKESWGLSPALFDVFAFLFFISLVGLWRNWGWDGFPGCAVTKLAFAIRSPTLHRTRTCDAAGVIIPRCDLTVHNTRIHTHWGCAKRGCVNPILI